MNGSMGLRLRLQLQARRVENRSCKVWPKVVAVNGHGRSEQGHVHALAWSRLESFLATLYLLSLTRATVQREMA